MKFPRLVYINTCLVNLVFQILPNTFIHIIKLQSLDLELNKIKTVSGFKNKNNLSYLDFR